MLNKIEVGKVYKHKKGNSYIVVHFGRFKDSYEGVWLDCVTYTPIKDKSKFYTRLLDDFANNFIEKDKNDL